MTVIRPNSISGINSITARTNEAVSFYEADGTTGNVIAGVVTATNLNGALPASNLTGALPAISAANLTNIPGANITGTIPAAALGNVDLDTLNANIAILGFKVAVNGTLAKYNLVDQVIDEFTDATGVDASASTNESLSGGAYSGATPVTPTVTGGTVTTDGNYKVHTFAVGSSNFVTDSALTIDYLIVGGGGAGGRADGGGGGGGAGGLVYKTGQNIAAGTFAVVVGEGGTGVAAQTGQQWADAPDGDPGETSSFNGDEGGGGAGGPGSSQSDSPAQGQRDGWGGDVSGKGNGGSGSGHSGKANGTGGAAGSKGTTNAGGGGDGNSGNDGGGGGGAGGAGGSSTQNNGGAGGAGLQYSITGSALWYAGGGGGNSEGGTGGNGGSGVGGNGQSGSTVSGQDGMDGRGGGGGGTDSHTHGEHRGSHGGDGTVIIRRPAQVDGPGGDLTLQSVANTASSAPSKADLVILMENSTGTATINTDIKGYVSRDNGSNWTQGTFVDEGTWGTNKKILSFHNLDISGQPSGTAMKYKITTHNQGTGSKVTKIHATSLGWK